MPFYKASYKFFKSKLQRKLIIYKIYKIYKVQEEK